MMRVNRNSYMLMPSLDIHLAPWMSVTLRLIQASLTLYDILTEGTNAFYPIFPSYLTPVFPHTMVWIFVSSQNSYRNLIPLMVVPRGRTMLWLFWHRCDQLPDRNILRQEIFIWLSISESFSPLQQKRYVRQGDSSTKVWTCSCCFSHHRWPESWE